LNEQKFRKPYSFLAPPVFHGDEGEQDLVGSYPGTSHGVFMEVGAFHPIIFHIDDPLIS
jgi:hypothetical protein